MPALIFDPLSSVNNAVAVDNIENPTKYYIFTKNNNTTNYELLKIKIFTGGQKNIFDSRAYTYYIYNIKRPYDKELDGVDIFNNIYALVNLSHSRDDLFPSARESQFAKILYDEVNNTFRIIYKVMPHCIPYNANFDL